MALGPPWNEPPPKPDHGLLRLLPPPERLINDQLYDKKQCLSSLRHFNEKKLKLKLLAWRVQIKEDTFENLFFSVFSRDIEKFE